MERQLRFHVDPEVLKLGIRGTYLRMKGLKNCSADSALDGMVALTIENLLRELTPEAIETDPQLQGFRRLHDAVKRSNKKNVASPENLLALTLERRSMPRINALVDVYNLVSLESKLALGAHDVEKIAGDVHLRITDGSETFWPLGSPEKKNVAPGEYAYIDSSNEIICRLEVRQVEKTKVGLHTTDCFYIIQGSAHTSDSLLKATTQRLISLTQSVCGGESEILYTTAN
jgi:DNA/RNA-binding domain of Phe-tRNA-synthetase-like protein